MSDLAQQVLRAVAEKKAGAGAKAAAADADERAFAEKFKQLLDALAQLKGAGLSNGGGALDYSLLRHVDDQARPDLFEGLLIWFGPRPEIESRYSSGWFLIRPRGSYGLLNHYFMPSSCVSFDGPLREAKLAVMAKCGLGYNIQHGRETDIIAEAIAWLKAAADR